MKRISFHLFLIAMTFSILPLSRAAISVGPAGVGPLNFDTRPALADGWSTRSTPGGAGNLTTVSALDAAVQTNSASLINTALGSSATFPPSDNTIARWNSTGLFVQSRPTDNSYIALMATLQNDAGSPASEVTISYALNALTSSDSTINEHIYGHRVFWSLTGAANSWRLIPDLSAGTTPLAAYPTTLTATVNLLASGSSWGIGSSLYLLWADDNGPSSDTAPQKEGAYTIDDFSVVPTLTNEPASIVITSPADNTVYPRSKNLDVTTQVGGSISSVDFLVDEIVAQTDPTPPFTASIDTTFLSLGNHTLRAVGQVTTGGTVTSTNQNFFIVENQAPTIAITDVYWTNTPSVTGTEFLVGTPVAVRVDVADDVSVTNVEWTINDQFYVNRGSNAPNIILVDGTAGIHTISGVAVDNSGQRSTPASVIVMLTNPAPDITLLVTNGAFWRYYDSNLHSGFAAQVPPPNDGFSDWHGAFYADSAWNLVQAEVGGGDEADGYPERTTIDIGPANGRYLAHYYRQTFDVADPSAFENLQIRLLRDDGAIVYLNGLPVWTNNMATVDLDPSVNLIAYTNRASASDDGLNYQVLNILGSAQIQNLLQTGENIAAVEVHQQNNTSSDTTFDLMIWGEAPALPSVTITAPTNGQMFLSGDTVAVTAIASTFITNVIFRLDDVPQSNDDTPPSLFTGVIPGVPFGSHVITAVAEDLFGNRVTSEPVVINVLANERPSVTITNPAGGSFYFVGVTVPNISASASDTDGTVSSVEFYVDDHLYVTDTSVPYGFDLCDITAGIHAVSAVAVDSSSGRTTNTISITATNPPGITAIVTNGSTWKHLDDGSDQGSAWRALGFDDRAWGEGIAEIGYGDAPGRPERTTVGFGPDSDAKYPTTYFRKSFTVADPTVFTNLIVRLLRDDGGIVYINGTTVFRSSISNVFDPVLFSTYTPPAVSDDGTVYQVTNVSPAILQAGLNQLAVEIHQDSGDSSDISFDLMLWGESGRAPGPQVSIVNNGTQIVISWQGTGITLQSAPAVTGPYSDLTSTSPLIITLPASGASRFFRLRQ